MRQRMDDGAHIVGCDDPQHFDLAGFAIHMDLGHLSTKVGYVIPFLGGVLHRHGERQCDAIGDGLFDLGAGFHNRLALGVSNPAGPGSLVVGHAVGIPNPHADPVDGYSHLAGHHLFLDGMGAGADVHGGTDYGEGTVGLCSQHNPSHSAADLTAKQGNPPAVPWPVLWLVPTGGVQGGIHDFTDLQEVDGPAQAVFLAGQQDVDPSENGWVHAQFTGQQVGMALQSKGVLVGAGCAEVAAGHGVGIDLQKLEGCVGYPVGAAHVVVGRKVGPGLQGPIGPAVMDGADFAGGDLAVALDARFDGDEGGVGRVTGGEFFHRAHDDLDRPIGHLRQQISDGQVAGVALTPEIAPDGCHVDPDGFFAQAQGFGHLPPGPEGRLAGAPSLYPAVIVDVYDASERLDITLMTAGDGELVLQDHVGFCKTLIEVSFGPIEPSLAVVNVRRQEFGGRSHIGCDVVVEQRGIGLHGFHWVKDRRQHLVVDVYQQQRFVGGLWGLRRHRRHPVSDVADLVPAKDGEVPQNLALKETAGVISRDDGLYTGDSPGCCGVESADSGVGVGTAQYLAGQHAGQDDVGGIQGLASDLIRTVDAADGLSDDFRLGNHLFLSLCPLFKCPFCHPERSEGLVALVERP